ncbi:predicted protein [Aspergillus nidulans FGSC A4]|uniref:Uncharacterized protein n=1 Tax=Emericella nidulans (strain FGSC A4 / ATCC 38163 / CBS 112.46 / NRRL 194 / M139) TaxID=227321 RepID=Q5B6D7_EMENI|nr:hypothetical protein [Aspergillus nidulans FGSC A4]EAA59158.1 predicted protein [Aspergillus nidulans FGSC A4]CBF75154.1 TPA: conserved hypothetical protein [Aspergillus nidulans FGSC A4]|eukprot:XP_661497.1 predicted protein [Aspergillus nidulans FGSC A4]
MVVPSPESSNLLVPFPPGSGGDYHDGPLLNVHDPTVPIHHGKGPIPRDAQTASILPFAFSLGDYQDEPDSQVAARDGEGHEPYLNVHGPTIPILPEDVDVTVNLTPRDEEGKELDTSKFDGHCRVNGDCNVGSFCIANWCTAALELDDGTLVLPPRDLVGEDFEHLTVGNVFRDGMEWMGSLLVRKYQVSGVYEPPSIQSVTMRGNGGARRPSYIPTISNLARVFSRGAILIGKRQEMGLCFYNNLTLVSEEAALLRPIHALQRAKSGQRSYP